MMLVAGINRIYPTSRNLGMQALFDFYQQHPEFFNLAMLVLLVFCTVTYISTKLRCNHFRMVVMSYWVFERIQYIGCEKKLFVYLRKMNPYLFEELILTALKKGGYKIVRNKAYSNDGGIDGRVYIKGNLYYIQAKRYKAHITKSHVEQLNWACYRDKVGGLFVHTGKTGKGSWKACGHKVTMVSGDNLLTLLRSPKDWQPIK